jgi:hypothetical protein
MKHSRIALLAVSLVVCLAFAFPATAAEKVFLTLASGSPGGAYYPLGGGMSVVIQKTVEGFRCASESTGASVENSRLVGNGDSDMGMVMGSVGYNAAEGKKPFEKKYDIVSLFQMYPAPQHLVTTAQSGIKKIADLKGKRVSIDVPGSGCSTMSKIILEEAGFNLEKDLKIANRITVFSGFDEFGEQGLPVADGPGGALREFRAVQVKFEFIGREVGQEHFAHRGAVRRNPGSYLQHHADDGLVPHPVHIDDMIAIQHAQTGGFFKLTGQALQMGSCDLAYLQAVDDRVAQVKDFQGGTITA